MKYQSLQSLAYDISELIQPADRVSISEAAEKHRYLSNAPQYVGHWDNSIAPYLVEIMDTLQSLDYTGLIFAGPARCGKSDIFFNWLAHTALYDPMDMMFVAMTQNVARDWSITDLQRMLRHSEDVGDMVLPGRNNKNVHDVRFRKGWRLLVKWPTITELSGKTIGRGWMADYDRFPEDLDGEGSPFLNGQKRGQTFNRYNMWVAESSPGWEVLDPKARLPIVGLSTRTHSAPPTKGILDLYNKGDRRRWYWRCPFCREPFEGTFECLEYPDSNDIAEAAAMATCKCQNPACGMSIDPSFKQELNAGGKWIKDGMIWLPDGSVAGKPPSSKLASFWLFGPSAAFQSWEEIVRKYLEAMRTYKTTGDISPLKSTVNTDQGSPFTPPIYKQSRSPEWLEQRQVDWGGTKFDPWVPLPVRFLIATVDVQAGNRSGFVVQVHGIDKDMNVYFVDMFKLKDSRREDGDTGRMLPLDPASYPEDWDVLVDEVMKKTYTCGDESGRRMAIRLVGCDSGGAEGVTPNAYNFWRRLRDGSGVTYPLNSHRRFQLIKGMPTAGAPMVRIAMPNSQRKDRNAGARGEIPVAMMNSNLLKDQIDGMLNRTDEGRGLVWFPKWSPDWLYSQLTGEIRIDGEWKNQRRVKNEAWDLFYYCMGLLASDHIKFEHIKWDRPPPWAEEWDKNELVYSPEAEEEMPFEKKKKPLYDLAKLAQEVG